MRWRAHDLGPLVAVSPAREGAMPYTVLSSARLIPAFSSTAFDIEENRLCDCAFELAAAIFVAIDAAVKTLVKRLTSY